MSIALKMSIALIKSGCYLFGILDELPIIDGFTVLAKRDDFTIATQGSKEFFVQTKARYWTLCPVEMRAGKRICRTDKAINIPK